MDEKKLLYYVNKNLKERTGTLSFNKLESKLDNSELDKRDLDYLGLFLMFAEKGKLNKHKNPGLVEVKNSFEKDLEDKLSTSYKMLEVTKAEANWKSRDLEFKEKVRSQLEKMMQNENVNLNTLSKNVDLSYANLYNFFKKKQYGKLSRESLERVQDYFWHK